MPAYGISSAAPSAGLGDLSATPTQSTQRYASSRVPSRSLNVLLRAFIAAGGVLLVACGAGPTTAAKPAPSPPPTPVNCSERLSGGGPLQAHLTGLGVSGDKLLVDFDTSTPGYLVLPQASTDFIASPSGLPVHLAGSSGASITLRHVPSGTFAGNRDLKPAGSVIKEARILQDFEGVLTIGIGLSRPACLGAPAPPSVTRFVVGF